MSTEAGARANALDLFRLDGKTAVVTGGGRGLGQYMAEALSDAGARVVPCSRKKDATAEVKAGMEGRGGVRSGTVHRRGPIGCRSASRSLLPQKGGARRGQGGDRRPRW